MTRLRICLILVLTCVLVSCGGDKPSFSLLAAGDQFRQSPNSVNNKLDVLFVVDNSSSMSNDQTNLANNFRSFIQEFTRQGYDFHIGVTATDAWRSTMGGSTSLAKLKDGTSSHSGIFVITPATTDIEGTFVINATTGIGGSGDERAFSSFRNALESPLNTGYGFRRADAFLAIIIVSDEDDFSHDNTTATTSYTYPGLHTIQSYVDWLSTFTGSTTAYKRYSTSAIYTDTNACATSKGGGARVGIRYEQLITATDGIKGSICDTSFANSLKVIAGRIAELSTQFYLSREPVPSSIRVWVDDVEVMGDATNGWTYHSDTQSIRFHGTSIPPQDATISVTFDPVTIQ